MNEDTCSGDMSSQQLTCQALKVVVTVVQSEEFFVQLLF